MSLAYYMDVHVPAAITDELRRRGVRVRTSQDEGTTTSDDENLLEQVSALDCLLFTQDEDFLKIGARRQGANKSFPGIVFSKQIGVSLGKLIDDLHLIAEAYTASETANRILYLPLR